MKITNTAAKQVLLELAHHLEQFNMNTQSIGAVVTLALVRELKVRAALVAMCDPEGDYNAAKLASVTSGAVMELVEAAAEVVNKPSTKASKKLREATAQFRPL